MNNRRETRCTLAALLLLIVLATFSSPSYAAPLTLAASEGHVSLAGHLEVLKDSTGKLTIQDVTTPPYSSHFKKTPDDHISGFVQQGAVWLRFTILRPAVVPQEWLLEIEPAYSERIQVYTMPPAGGFEQRSGGILQPASKREEPYRLDLFRLAPPPDQPWTIHLRIASHRTILTRPTLWQPDALKRSALIEGLVHGAYLGIVLLIACINILYWLRLKQRLYFYYSCYVFGLTILFIDYNGYLHQFLITDKTWLMSPVIRLNLIFLIVSNVGVCSHLLNLQKNLPRAGLLYRRFFLGLSAVFAALVLAGYSDSLVIPVLLSLFTTAIISAAIGIYLIARGVPGAILYLAAFGTLLIAGCAKILVLFDITPEIFPPDLLWFSSLVHILIMNLAVTNQITRVITEKQTVESELATERKTVEQQRQFLRLISHELRTPLAIIDSTAQILPLLHNDHDKSTEKTNAILAATRRMKDLLDNCLSGDRLSIDGIVPVIKAINIQAIVRNTMESAQTGTHIHRMKLETTGLPATFPCDDVLLEILLRNLLDNAIKYSPDGGDITLRGWSLQPGELMLQVKDSGTGISSEDTDRIFDQYYRSGQVPGVSGAGLGLYLVQQIARLHGGDVACTSKPGLGSTFTVRLCASTP